MKKLISLALLALSLNAQAYDPEARIEELEQRVAELEGSLESPEDRDRRYKLLAETVAYWSSPEYKAHLEDKRKQAMENHKMQQAAKQAEERKYLEARRAVQLKKAYQQLAALIAGALALVGIIWAALSHKQAK